MKLGLTDVNVDYSANNIGLTRIRAEFVANEDFDIRDFVKTDFAQIFPNKPIVKCAHCGQWGAVMCACPQCGAPIDPVK